MKKIALLSGIVVAGVLVFSTVLYTKNHLSAQTQTNEELCMQIHAKSGAVPEGFGAPYNPFSSAKEANIIVVCEGNQANVEVMGTHLQYIYKMGYEFVDGNWRPLTLSGPSPDGDWFIAAAKAPLSAKGSELNKQQYVVAYVCTWLGNGTGEGWKCGCRNASCSQNMWQLQGFSGKTKIDAPMWEKKRQAVKAASQKKLTFAVSSVVPGQVVRGSSASIMVEGVGFMQSGNTVVLTNQSDSSQVFTVPNLAMSLGGLTFKLPAQVAEGKYTVSVKHSGGTSKIGMLLIVTPPGATPPAITSITPQKGAYGSTVTIHGSGFTPTGNDVYWSYGVLRNLPSSNGTTITFIAKSPANSGVLGMQEAADDPNINGELPSMVSIVNSNGGSDYLPFTLVF